MWRTWQVAEELGARAGIAPWGVALMPFGMALPRNNTPSAGAVHLQSAPRLWFTDPALVG